jgi:hypothetical protein
MQCNRDSDLAAFATPYFGYRIFRVLAIGREVVRQIGNNIKAETLQLSCFPTIKAMVTTFKVLLLNMTRRKAKYLRSRFCKS